MNIKTFSSEKLIYAKKLLVKNPEAKVIYDGRSWTVYHAKQPAKEFPRFLEILILKLKLLFSKSYIEKNIHANLRIVNASKSFSEQRNKIQPNCDDLQQDLLDIQEVNKLEEEVEAIKSFSKKLDDEFNKKMIEAFGHPKDTLLELLQSIKAWQELLGKSSNDKTLLSVKKWPEVENLSRKDPYYDHYFINRFQMLSALRKLMKVDPPKQKQNYKNQQKEIADLSSKFDQLHADFILKLKEHVKIITIEHNKIKEIEKNDLYKRKTELKTQYETRCKELIETLKPIQIETITEENFKSAIYAAAKIKYFSPVGIEIPSKLKDSFLKETFNIEELIAQLS